MKRILAAFAMALLAGAAFGQSGTGSGCPDTGCPLAPNSTIGLWSNGHWGGTVEQPTDPNSPVGLWRTIDDSTNKPKGVVMIVKRNGEFFGSVQAKLVDDPRRLCIICPGDRKDAEVIGLEILRHGRLSKKGPNVYEGKVLDPEQGKEYSGYLNVLEGGTKLKMSGCVLFGLICRSQVWERLDSMPPEAHL
jgi:uncharacterized protein (DUF2147 family)